MQTKKSGQKRPSIEYEQGQAKKQARKQPIEENQAVEATTSSLLL